jgi:hypothetical protein
VLDVEKIRRDFPILARVIWYSIAAPRQAVRELCGATDIRLASWILVITGTIVMAVASGVGSWFELRNSADVSEFTFFGPGQVLAEALSWAIIEAAFALASYPVAVLLWTYVFGFRDKVQLVRVAVAVSFAVMIFLGPAIELLPFLFRSVGFGEVYVAAILVYFAIAIALCTIYYAEALSISLLRSMLITIAVSAMILVGIIILLAVLLFLYAMIFGLSNFLETGPSP